MKDSKKQTKFVSEENIESFVNEMIQNDQINISYLPDSFEKKIYKDILTIIMALVEQIIESTKINFMGHAITLNLEPQKKKEDASENRE